MGTFTTNPSNGGAGGSGHTGAERKDVSSDE